MRAQTFCKFGISIGAAALLVTMAASPAMADPAANSYPALVGLGSDTTQDVMNGVAAAIGGNTLGSYDAVGTGLGDSVVTRSGAAATLRANGSGAGRDLLRVAIGQTPNASIAVTSGATGQATAGNSTGLIDYARSSGTPAAADTAANGVVTYIPFATDAVDIAFAAGSPLASATWTVGTSSDSPTATTLYNLYHGLLPYVYVTAQGGYVGMGASATAPTGATAQKVIPYLPKAGSGTRSYFIGKVGLTEAQVATLQGQGLVTDTYNGSPVQEHDGTAISGSPYAAGPYSIGKWVSMANGLITDARHGVQLATLNTQSPTTGSGTSYALNSGYNALTRLVYNIVPSSLADDSTSAIAKTFVGTGSLVCKQAAAITKYGFAPLTAASGASSCGNTSFRAYTASVSSVTESLSAGTVGTGDSVTATANVTSTNNGGGVVNFYDGTTKLGSAALAAGATSTSAKISPTSAGTISVTAQFVPTLTGVAASVSGAQPLKVSANASKTSLGTVTKKFTAGKRATVKVSVTAAGNPGGKVALTSGKKKVASATVKKGSSSVKVSFVPSQKKYQLEATFTPTAGAAQSSSKVMTITVAKASPKLKVTLPKKIAAAGKTKVAVTVVAGSLKASGTITVKSGSKTIVKSVTVKKGKATVTLPKLGSGSHKLTFSYGGSSVTKKAAKSVTVTANR